MLNYFAVIKTNFNASPMKLSFVAADVNDALKEMCRCCGCATTNELAEYDLLEVVGNNKYLEVASKIGNEIRRRAPIETPAIDTGEKQYVPYILATHEDTV